MPIRFLCDCGKPAKRVATANCNKPNNLSSKVMDKMGIFFPHVDVEFTCPDDKCRFYYHSTRKCVEDGGYWSYILEDHNTVEITFEEADKQAEIYEEEDRRNGIIPCRECPRYKPQPPHNPKPNHA